MKDLRRNHLAGVLTGAWRTSSFTNQGNCVELAPTVDGVALRNSNSREQGTLHVPRSALAAALDAARAGDLDDLC
jgi:hypothetical protein